MMFAHHTRGSSGSGGTNLKTFEGEVDTGVALNQTLETIGEGVKF
jgi:hypothetical protein